MKEHVDALVRLGLAKHKLELDKPRLKDVKKMRFDRMFIRDENLDT